MTLLCYGIVLNEGRGSLGGGGGGGGGRLF